MCPGIISDSDISLGSLCRVDISAKVDFQHNFDIVREVDSFRKKKREREIIFIGTPNLCSKILYI